MCANRLLKGHVYIKQLYTNHQPACAALFLQIHISKSNSVWTTADQANATVELCLIGYTQFSSVLHAESEE